MYFHYLAFIKVESLVKLLENVKWNIRTQLQNADPKDKRVLESEVAGNEGEVGRGAWCQRSHSLSAKFLLTGCVSGPFGLQSGATVSI